MRIVLETLTKFLALGSRKVLSNPRNTNLPNIFVRHDPRAAARSAKVRTTKSAAWARSTAARGGQTRAARRQANAPLQRCNTALVPQPATYPHPPGAYILEPSFIIPGFPEIDHRHIPLPVLQKMFLDALFAGRRAVLRAADEREAQAAAAEYARLVELQFRKAQEARCRAQEAEYVRMLEEDRRRAEELHRRAVEERRRVEQEREREWSRREEQRKRREREQRERCERERRERERYARQAAESAQPDPAYRLNIYKAQWVSLLGNVAPTEPLHFSDIPWPVFETVRRVEDVTEERVLAFVFHALHAHILEHGEGQAKATRSELRLWHPDQFNRKVLHKVTESDREAVEATAGQVARLLTRI